MFGAPEFRAPPPSPVDGVNGHGPEYAADNDELAAFLSHSLRVPTLHLPHHIFPQEATAWDPPEIDCRKLNSPGDGRSCGEHLKSAASAFGCFQLVNHGIPPDLVAAIGAAAVAAFGIPPDDKAKATRTSQRRWGFEIEEEGEGNELLWWCRAAAKKDEAEMAGIWRRENYMSFRYLAGNSIFAAFFLTSPSDGYAMANWQSRLHIVFLKCSLLFFPRDKVEELWREIEKVASKIEEVLLDGDADINAQLLESRRGEAVDGSLICFHASKRDYSAGVKHELLRMLVSRSQVSSCLSLHLLGEASELHFYSKKGWYRSCPGTTAAIIVTVGDQMQVKYFPCQTLFWRSSVALEFTTVGNRSLGRWTILC